MMRALDRHKTWLYAITVTMLLAAATVTLAAGNDNGPLELVQQTSAKMLDAIRKDRDAIDKDKNRLFDLVEQIVLPHFDFERMSKLVLGKYWRRASDEQRREFSTEFRFLLVRTYATAMLEYTDQKINYLPLRADPGASEVVVQTEVEQNGGFPIPIDYKMFKNDQGQWKVYEVSIDGVGLVINYRSSFSTEIRGKEGLDGLIKTLRARNAEARNE
jgi:phospholipid transport system substrate-binding protein